MSARHTINSAEQRLEAFVFELEVDVIRVDHVLGVLSGLLDRYAAHTAVPSAELGFLCATLKETKTDLIRMADEIVQAAPPRPAVRLCDGQQVIP